MKRSHECRRRAGRAATPTGTIGAPVVAASATMPACRRRAGPRGPSGTTATSSPARIARASSRRASTPPRDDEPRTTSRSKRRAKSAISWPSRERLASTRTRRAPSLRRSRAFSHGTMRMRPCQTA